MSHFGIAALFCSIWGHIYFSRILYYIEVLPNEFFKTLNWVSKLRKSHFFAIVGFVYWLYTPWREHYVQV